MSKASELWDEWCENNEHCTHGTDNGRVECCACPFWYYDED